MRKLTYAEVKNNIENKGYELISTEYKNNSSNIMVKCNNGHIYETRYSTICGKNSRGCPYCYGNVRKNIEEVRQLFLSNKIELLSDTYTNNKTLMDVKCSKCNHNFTTSVWKVKRGLGCKKCSAIKYDKEDIMNKLLKINYSLISPYINAHTKINVMCNEGHTYETTFTLFQKGVRCSYCSRNHRLSYDHVKNYIENKGWKLLSKTYLNNSTKLDIICDKGHHIKKTFQNIQSGRTCLECHKISTTSKQEKEVLFFVSSIYNGLIIENDRTQLFNQKTNSFLELDIWLPECNKAIEFNGVYWHKNRKENDLLKEKLCKERQIKLLVILDEEWSDDKERILLNIKEFVYE